MDIKYKVGQEVYVMGWNLFEYYEFDLECSQDVQDLLKEIVANKATKVIKEKIKAIHIYDDNIVRYDTQSRGCVMEHDISLSAEDAKKKAIKKFQEAYIKRQIRLLREFDEGLTKILNESEEA